MIIGLPSALQSRYETKSFYTNLSRPLKVALSYVKSFLASSFNLDSRSNILNAGNVKKTYKDTGTPLIFLSLFKVKLIQVGVKSKVICKNINAMRVVILRQNLL